MVHHWSSMQCGSSPLRLSQAQTSKPASSTPNARQVRIKGWESHSVIVKYAIIFDHQACFSHQKVTNCTGTGTSNTPCFVNNLWLPEQWQGNIVPQTLSILGVAAIATHKMQRNMRVRPPCLVNPYANRWASTWCPSDTIVCHAPRMDVFLQCNCKEYALKDQQNSAPDI